MTTSEKVYTILFTDAQLRTAAIVVVAYAAGEQAMSIIRHAHQKRRDYKFAYLLDSERSGFTEDPFWVKTDKDEQMREVHYALLALQHSIDIDAIPEPAR